jgi:hypothetical protein
MQTEMREQTRYREVAESECSATRRSGACKASPGGDCFKQGVPWSFFHLPGYRLANVYPSLNIGLILFSKSLILVQQRLFTIVRQFFETYVYYHQVYPTYVKSIDEWYMQHSSFS